MIPEHHLPNELRYLMATSNNIESWKSYQTASGWVFIVRHKDGQEYFLTMTPMDNIINNGVVKEAEDIVRDV